MCDFGPINVGSGLKAALFLPVGADQFDIRSSCLIFKVKAVNLRRRLPAAFSLIRGGLRRVDALGCKLIFFGVVLAIISQT